MRGAVITILIVLAAVVLAGFLIFSGNDGEIQNNENSVPDMTNPAPEENPPEQEIQPQTHNIDIKNFAFSPKTLTIKVGDTVAWTNSDLTRHTVTSDSGSGLDSSLLSQGQSYTYTFTESGTFNYHCAPHPYMKGTITVE